MKVTVEKLTDVELLSEACNYTINGKLIDKDKKLNLDKHYKACHSPVRTQLFKILMEDIPTFASTHFVRHAQVGQLHYVMTQRDDRGGEGNDISNRNTPTKHMMILNAQHLIDMSRKRLCGKSHIKTQEIMHMIKDAIADIDPDLANNMVKECEYRGKCNEFVPCSKENLYTKKE